MGSEEVARNSNWVVFVTLRRSLTNEVRAESWEPDARRSENDGVIRYVKTLENVRERNLARRSNAFA